jgi:lipid-A-disaccharide synthase
MSRSRTLALLAGETSGDQLGGWLMQALKAADPQVQCIGTGGTHMQAQGLASLFPMTDISLMGFAEILPHLVRLKRRINETVHYLEATRPDTVVTIDSPGFTMRVVKALRARGIITPRFVHYVAPTVWAYKPERVHTFKANVDLLLCLLPFEPPYFEAVKLPVHFVGHEIAWWWKTRGDGLAFRHRYDLGEAPLLALFPGSRHGELDRMWPIFEQSIAMLMRQIPNLRVVIQVPPHLLPRLMEATQHWSLPPLILSNVQDKKDLFAAATVAIAKSGTIGLECALAGLASIVAYRAHPLTAMMLRRMVRVKYVNLANLLVDREAIPEYIQERCTPENIASAALPLLVDANARAAQQRDVAQVAYMLGSTDTLSPSEKAARLIL